jgi:hypothetical protein
MTGCARIVWCAASPPNPSLNRTRYGKHRKPGLRHMVHHLSPGSAARLTRCQRHMLRTTGADDHQGKFLPSAGGPSCKPPFSHACLCNSHRSVVRCQALCAGHSRRVASLRAMAPQDGLHAAACTRVRFKVARGCRNRSGQRGKVTLGAAAQCCLTPRSTGPATARRLGRAAPWFILHRAAQAPCLRGPVSSNVRRHRTGRAVFQQEVRLRRGLEQPRGGQAAKLVDAGSTAAGTKLLLCSKRSTPSANTVGGSPRLSTRDAMPSALPAAAGYRHRCGLYRDGAVRWHATRRSAVLGQPRRLLPGSSGCHLPRRHGCRHRYNFCRAGPPW